MKYWRGYLVAVIFAALSWGLTQFAKAHASLVDMIYPYVTRLIQTALADWSSGAAFCLWQVVLVALIVALLASIVLMVVLRWNPVQWFGWVCAAVCLFSFLNTGLYGLNVYAGSVADDVRLNIQEGYTPSELSDAASYFRDKANALSAQVNRDSAYQLSVADFDTLAQQAVQGFEVLTYDDAISVFAGSTVPVKALGWSGYYTDRGITGVTVALTGEAAVNPEVPALGLPFAMCREMARRMCIYSDDDASFSAFLACEANESLLFQYAGYALAYRACHQALASSTDSAQRSSAANIHAGASALVKADLAQYDAFLENRSASNDSTDDDSDPTFTDMLVSWYIQEYVLPLHIEEDVRFDPLDESQVDLSGLVNAAG